MKKLLGYLKKPVLFTMILIIAVIILLNACAGKKMAADWDTHPGATDTARQKASQTMHTGAPVTISFWFPWVGGFQQEFYETVVKPFEEANPDIKVKMTFVENSDNSQTSDKLLTAIAGGKAPDVAMFDRFIVGEWAAMGTIEDLTEYAVRDDMEKYYYKGVWSESQYKGKTYALPWNMDSRAMFYNKTLMEEAGLDPGKPPATIAEMDAMAEKIFKKNKDGSYERVGFIPWSGQGFLYTHGWNFGGEWEKDGELTPNDPHIVKALEWMQGYARKYDSKKLLSFTDAMRQTGRHTFLSGKIGFVYEGNWLLNDMDSAGFEWGVAPMPTEDGDQSVTWSGGWSFVMPKGAKNKEQAWRFIKFIAGKEGSLLWGGRAANKNDLTCIPEVNAVLGFDKKENLAVFTSLLKHAHIRPVTPVGGYMWDEMYRVQKLASTLQGDPKQLLDEMKKNVDTELAKVMAGGRR